MKDKIFISYAREDLENAERMYKDIQANGLHPWMDKFSISPGKNWREEIELAIRSSRYFILLLSSNSISKRGYCQKEIKLALDVLSEFPSGEVFIIPVRLDECESNDASLNALQRVDLFPYKDGLYKILQAIYKDADELESIGDKIIQEIIQGKSTEAEIKAAILKYVSTKNTRQLTHRELSIYSELLETLHTLTVKQLAKEKRIKFLLGLLVATGVLGEAVKEGVYQGLSESPSKPKDTDLTPNPSRGSAHQPHAQNSPHDLISPTTIKSTASQGRPLWNTPPGGRGTQTNHAADAITQNDVVAEGFLRRLFSAIFTFIKWLTSSILNN